VLISPSTGVVTHSYARRHSLKRTCVCVCVCSCICVSMDRPYAPRQWCSVLQCVVVCCSELQTLLCGVFLQLICTWWTRARYENNLYNTLQHTRKIITTTHLNTLQHIATNCNKLRRWHCAPQDMRCMSLCVTYPYVCDTDHVSVIISALMSV